MSIVDAISLLSKNQTHLLIYAIFIRLECIITSEGSTACAVSCVNYRRGRLMRTIILREFHSLVIDFRLVETVFHIFREMIVTNQLVLFVTLLFFCCIHQGTLNSHDIAESLHFPFCYVLYIFFCPSSSCRKQDENKPRIPSV